MGLSGRVAGYAFLSLAITALFIVALNSLVDWNAESHRTSRLQQTVKAAVVRLETGIPPGMVIEIENTGKTSVGRTHVAMEFKALNSRFNRRQNWSLISLDIEGLEPGEKKQLKLLCRPEDFSPGYRNLSEKRVAYSLMIYPEWRDPIRPIQGEAVLK